MKNQNKLNNKSLIINSILKNIGSYIYIILLLDRILEIDISAIISYGVHYVKIKKLKSDINV